MESKVEYFSKWLLILSAAWLAVFFVGFDNPHHLLAHNWTFIVAGVAGAVIGNLTAIGGGIVFMPLLIGVYHMDPVSALKLTFVTQAVGMTSGALCCLKRKSVPLGLLWWTIPPLLVGSMVSTFCLHPKGIYIKALFGPISILVGLCAWWVSKHHGTLEVLPKRALGWLVAVSLIGGLVTGWVAIGEGEIVAAFLIIVYGYHAHKGIGLGVVLLAVNSILLAGVHAFHFGGIPWDIAIFTMIGVLWGGRLGAYLAQYIDHGTVKRIFAVVAIVDGAFMIIHFLTR